MPNEGERGSFVLVYGKNLGFWASFMGYSGPDPESPNGPHELKSTLGDTFDPTLITLWWFGQLLAWLAYKTIFLSKVWHSI